MDRIEVSIGEAEIAYWVERALLDDAHDWGGATGTEVCYAVRNWLEDRARRLLEEIAHYSNLDPEFKSYVDRERGKHRFPEMPA